MIMRKPAQSTTSAIHRFEVCVLVELDTGGPLHENCRRPYHNRSSRTRSYSSQLCNRSVAAAHGLRATRAPGARAAHQRGEGKHENVALFCVQAAEHVLANLSGDCFAALHKLLAFRRDDD